MRYLIAVLLTSFLACGGGPVEQCETSRDCKQATQTCRIDVCVDRRDRIAAIPESEHCAPDDGCGPCTIWLCDQATDQCRALEPDLPCDPNLGLQIQR